MAYVYLVTNTVNNKKYVGVTVTSVASRWARHLHDARNPESRQILHSAIRKYGSDKFYYQTIYENENRDFIVKVAENFFINMLDTHTTKHGYNQTYGGDGWFGMKHRPESILKMKNKTFSEETRRKMSYSAQHRGEKKEIVITAETADKIRRRLSGRKHSPEHTEKIRQAAIGRKTSQPAKEKMRLAKLKYHYKLWNKYTGEVVECQNLRKFSRDHSLNQSEINQTINKNTKLGMLKYSCKGWYGTKTPLTDVEKASIEDLRYQMANDSRNRLPTVPK